MQVEGQHEVCLQTLMATGARVSNAYPTCPVLGYSPAKAGLIPDVTFMVHAILVKVIRYGMGMRLIR